MEWNDEEEWEVIKWVRRRLTDRKRSVRPSAIKEMMAASALCQVNRAFRDGEFGIVSACREGNSKRQNLEAMVALSQMIGELGLYHVAQLGFWDCIPERGLFIPQIKKEEIRAAAVEFHQHAYCWGKDGQWFAFNTDDNEVLASGCRVKIISFDEEFMCFSRLAKKKHRLQTRLDEIQNKYGMARLYLEKTVMDLERKIEDLEKVEKELIDYD